MTKMRIIAVAETGMVALRATPCRVGLVHHIAGHAAARITVVDTMVAVVVAVRAASLCKTGFASRTEAIRGACIRAGISSAR